MTSEYDPIADLYRRSKRLPFRVYAEAPSHLARLGDLTGKSVLDLACGEGHYSRLIKKAGASRVVGVDLSAEMIALAKDQEAREPLGIEYHHAPAESLSAIGPFDLVSAAFLLNNAPDRATLVAMARAAGTNLAPGGRFVATDSALAAYPGADYSAYGMASDVKAPLPDGTPYHITFTLDGGDTFSITNVFHTRSTYETALKQAGFHAVRWFEPNITPEGIASFGIDHWRNFLEYPPIILIECE